MTIRMMMLLSVVICCAALGQPLPADYARGVNHAHIHRAGHGYGSPVARRQLDALKKLGVNWLALTPFGYQQSYDADRISIARDRTLTDTALIDEIKAARALGFKVVVKPHVWSHDFWDGKQWHGTIDQLDDAAHDRWWASLCELTLHYAQLAQAAGAQAFCVGTELVIQTKKYPQQWRQLIGRVRRVFKGQLTYAAHWATEFDQITFWDALDVVGINAYFPLDAPVGASVAQLVDAWGPHGDRMAAFSAKVGKPIVFLEVGYRAATGAHRKPWEYSGGQLSEQAQARAYTAMFESMSRYRWWRGAFLWKTFTDPSLGERDGDGTGFGFQNRAAQDVVRRWYGGE